MSDVPAVQQTQAAPSASSTEESNSGSDFEKALLEFSLKQSMTQMSSMVSDSRQAFADNDDDNS